MSVAPGDKWTTAIILTYSKRLKPEAKVFSYFYKQEIIRATAIMTVKNTTAAKKKKNLIIKGKNFRRSITPHHTTTKCRIRVVAIVRVQMFIFLR